MASGGPTPIPALDRLGADLHAALRARRRRRVPGLRPLLLALAAVVAIGVPAAATQLRWAEVVGGETALPGQAPAPLRLVLARGSSVDADWRFEVYPARIGARAGGGPVGVCAFLVEAGGDAGSGTCTARRPPRIPAVSAPGVRVVAGLVPGAASAVALHFDGGRTRRVPTVPIADAIASAHGLPTGLAWYAVPTHRPLVAAVPLEERP